MGFLKPSTPPLPPIPPAPEPPSAELSAEEKERIAKEQARIRRNRKGKRSTILTGPLGIQESEEEQLETLLGKKD
tara:strand:+ start:43 stop:267 length:225 start_codon:yes stop_codon:yes gene_type:complete